MRRGYRSNVRRSLLLGSVFGLAALALAVVLGWWVWRGRQDAASLFRRLPGENVLLLYLNVEQLRRTPALIPVLGNAVDPDPDYAAFVRQTGFDYQRDLDRAAVCYLPDRVYILARGRFDGARLRSYALDQGGACADSGLERPCRMPASQPGRQVSFLLLEPSLLALATAPEPDAARQLEAAPAVSAEPLAQAASTLNAGNPLLWATATPASLDRALRQTSAVPNLNLLAAALAGAQRAYLFVNDRSPRLEIALQAVCASDAQAAEIRRLLQGLNDLVGGLMRGARRGKTPDPWARVLASAAINQQKDTVRAVWALDPDLLKDLGTTKGAAPER